MAEKIPPQPEGQAEYAAWLEKYHGYTPGEAAEVAATQFGETDTPVIGEPDLMQPQPDAGD